MDMRRYLCLGMRVNAHGEESIKPTY